MKSDHLITYQIGFCQEYNLHINKNINLPSCKTRTMNTNMSNFLFNIAILESDLNECPIVMVGEEKKDKNWLKKRGHTKTQLGLPLCPR